MVVQLLPAARDYGAIRISQGPIRLQRYQAHYLRWYHLTPVTRKCRKTVPVQVTRRWLVALSPLRE